MWQEKEGMYAENMNMQLYKITRKEEAVDLNIWQVDSSNSIQWLRSMKKDGWKLLILDVEDE